VNIGILDVPAIFPEMGGDPVSAGGFAGSRGENGVRLISTPRLTKRGDVIDIDVEPLLLCWHCHRP
jgi:hypothetical protein